MRRSSIPAITLMVLAAVSCGPEPLEFADWTIPVEEGTRVVEYRAVPAGQRSEVIEFERDLVLAEAFARSLYQPRSFVVDGEGTVFVLDAGNHRVVVFDSRGEPLREFGRQGQGPGELQRPDRIGVAGGKVLVNDISSYRISVFTTAGEHVTDHLLDERFWAQDLVGFGEQLVAVNAQRAPAADRRPPAGRALGRWNFLRHGRRRVSGRRYRAVRSDPVGTADRLAGRATDRRAQERRP
jgi:hypothetical protein